MDKEDNTLRIIQQLNVPSTIGQYRVCVEANNRGHGTYGSCREARNTHNFFHPRHTDNHIIIKIDPVDVERLAETDNRSLRNAAVSLLRHEIGHILDDCYVRGRHGDVAPQLLNIASDMSINWKLNLGGCSLRAAHYHLPDFLSTDEYLKLLRSDDNPSQSGDDTPQRGDDNPSQSGEGCWRGPLPLLIDRPNDVAVTSRSGLSTHMDDDELLDIVDSTYVGADVTRIKAQLQCVAQSQTLNRVQRHSSFTKYPHRKDDLLREGFMVPGRTTRAAIDSIRPAAADGIHVLIDVSASTYGPLNVILNSIAKQLHALGNVTITFYCHELSATLTPTDQFKPVTVRGGTNVAYVITQLRDARMLHDTQPVFVITDGADDFTWLRDCDPRSRVWVIGDKAAITETLTPFTPTTL